LANKERLTAAVKKVLSEALPRTLSHREMWQAIWPRITYAGTLASKASLEIESMRSWLPLFQDLGNYDPASYRFDVTEWKSFVDHWKSRLTTKSHQTQWLVHAKKHPDWNPAEHFKNTSPQVWKILTRDELLYPGLKFSAKSDKVVKYLAVADFLHKHRMANPGALPLDHYTNGQTFDGTHHKGEKWAQERRVLRRVREQFEDQIGTMTALHTMMDMGFKTIKPDRVMTYLFSQLGWLQTLPRTLSKEQVIASYTRQEVVDEMTIRADVLAASLSQSHPEHASQAHRLLDIWLVKYGQNPEAAFGITRNLQGTGPGIWTVLQRVKDAIKGESSITSVEAALMWPAEEFHAIDVKGEKTSPPKARKTKRVQVVSRDEAGRLFFNQWRKGLFEQPNIYPDRQRGMDNNSKEQILRAIEKGTPPEVAFLAVLGAQ
jgi:hypothetical protein